MSTISPLLTVVATSFWAYNTSTLDIITWLNSSSETVSFQVIHKHNRFSNIKWMYIHSSAWILWFNVDPPKSKSAKTLNLSSGYNDKYHADSSLPQQLRYVRQVRQFTSGVKLNLPNSLFKEKQSQMGLKTCCLVINPRIYDFWWNTCFRYYLRPLKIFTVEDK